MKIRVRVKGVPLEAEIRQQRRRTALALASLMMPASLAAYALGLWRIAADLNITGEFAISKGIFSHWQVWVALGAGVQVAATTLSRYGHRQAEP